MFITSYDNSKIKTLEALVFFNSKVASLVVNTKTAIIIPDNVVAEYSQSIV